MAEVRSEVRLEIAELFEEARDLHDDAEDVFFGGMVVHGESLDGLVVFDDGIEPLFLKLLPVPRQVVLVVGVEK